VLHAVQLEQCAAHLLGLDGMQHKAAALDANRLAQIALARGADTGLPGGARARRELRADPPATVQAIEGTGSFFLGGAVDLIGAAIEHYFDT